MTASARSILALGLVFVAAMSSETLARTVTIVNRTGATVRGIFVSPVAEEAWGADRMGEYNLGHRLKRRIERPDGEGCRFDVRIILDRRSQELHVMDHDFCAESTLRATQEAGTLFERAE